METNKVLEYFKTHYNDTTVKEAADYFGYSESHFYRIFKEETGVACGVDVKMPMEETEWTSMFAAFDDKYGVSWMPERRVEPYYEVTADLKRSAVFYFHFIII
ncbi:MAG TPA: AraC family transcriptional regulator [Candidatus Salinicoccus merdavium]|nr:AraC family transcriptional regulator [Candidatus Salinicoccus merdavium]